MGRKKQKTVDGKVVVGIRMRKEFYEQLARLARQNVLPISLYARMLLKQAVNKVIEEEERVPKDA